MLARNDANRDRRSDLRLLRQIVRQCDRPGLVVVRSPSLSSVPSLENMNSSASMTLDLPLPFGAKIARQRFLLKSNVFGWRYARNPESSKD